MNININTGNYIVDTIGKMNITGNIIPEAWFSTIVNEKGNVNFIAINILADLVYWYRPSEIRDEHTNSVTYKKKFNADDFVQRSYKQICSKFNISEKQAREALKLLESLGVAKRHFRTINTSMGSCSNVMYLELIPSVLAALTFPNGTIDETKLKAKENSYCPKSKQAYPQKEIVDYSEDNTYTNITTEESSQISTTSDAVVNILKDLSLNENDIKTIVKVSNNDISKVDKAIKALKASHTKIDNVTGFLIKAIQRSYESKSYKPAKNSSHSFQQRTYDWDKLEQLILSN